MIIFFPFFSKAGGFFSAEDADSLPTETDTHKKEGAFCVWEEDEIRKLLQEERVTTKSGESVPVLYLFLKHYGVENEGNVKAHQVRLLSRLTSYLEALVVRPAIFQRTPLACLYPVKNQKH